MSSTLSKTGTKLTWKSIVWLATQFPFALLINLTEIVWDAELKGLGRVGFITLAEVASSK